MAIFALYSFFLITIKIQQIASFKKSYTIKFYLSQDNLNSTKNISTDFSPFNANNLSYYFKHPLLTYVCLGNPKKCIKTELSFSSKQTWFCYEHEYNQSSSIKKPKKNLYQPEKSNTFKKFNYSKEINTPNGIICGKYSQDILRIGNNNNNNNPLFFYIIDNCTDENNNSSGELGLGDEYVPYDLSSTSESLIDQLKKIEIIKTSIVRIKYINDTYGEVALGADYKNLNNNNHTKFFDLPMVNYSSIISTFVQYLNVVKEINDDESENSEKKIKLEFQNKLRLKIDFTSSFITVPQEIFDKLINISFSKYINHNKKLCKIKKNEDFDMKFLVCDQIILNTNLDRLIFELGWKTNIDVELKDLFLIQKDKSKNKKYIMFGIISQNNLKYIGLGDVFLKNFVIFLDNDNKLIRFYNKRSFKDVYDYTKDIILVSIIFFILILFLLYMLKSMCDRSKVETECPPEIKKFLNKDFSAYNNANKIIKTHYKRYKKKPKYYHYSYSSSSGTSS